MVTVVAMTTTRLWTAMMATDGDGDDGDDDAMLQATMMTTVLTC